jgi:hypothetical protein
MTGPLLTLLILSRFINQHGRHRQFMFMIVCFLKKKICAKGDNSNLNIEILVKYSYFSYELNYR